MALCENLCGKKLFNHKEHKEKHKEHKEEKIFVPFVVKKYLTTKNTKKSTKNTEKKLLIYVRQRNKTQN